MKHRQPHDEQRMVSMEFCYNLAAAIMADNYKLSEKLKECEKKIIVLEKQNKK